MYVYIYKSCGKNRYNLRISFYKANPKKAGED